MRAEPKTRERAPALPDLDAEREVDFGSVSRRVLDRWWIPALALLLGGLIGYLLALGGPELYQARATIYLGQTLSPTGNVTFQSPATNPATVSQLARSTSIVEEVARQVGVDAGTLRRGISTKAVAGATTRQAAQPTLLAEISVRGPWRRESAQAANALAETVIARLSPYVDTKIDALEEQLASQNRELAELDRRLETLQAAIRDGGAATSVERLQLLTLIGFAEQRRGQLVEDRTQTRQLLSLSQNVERSRVLTRASADRVTARSPRSSIIVGALIGLLAGIFLALLAEPGARFATAS